MALPVKYGCGFHLQFACINVALYLGIAMKVQEFLHGNVPGYTSHDICMEPVNIAFHSSFGSREKSKGP